jgi:putative redox protein
MHIVVTGTPDFKFKAKASNGYEFDIGASKSIGGDESGFRPMEVVLTALASCSGIDVVNILKKSRVDFKSVDIEVDADRKEGAIPSPFTKIHLKFFIHGYGIDRIKAEKAVSLSLEKYCSVSASLDPTIMVTASTHLDS